MTIYVSLYILSPYINKILKNCSKKEFLILIAFLLIGQIHFPILKINFKLFGTTDGHNILWFTTLYVIAAYIRLFPDTRFINNTFFQVIIFVCSFFSIFIFAFINIKLWNLTQVFCVISSITLFLLFKNIKMSNCKIINLISSTTLGVYLIHDNDFIRKFLWNSWLNVPKYALNDNFLLFSIISIITIYIVCTIIELLRVFLKNSFNLLYKKIRKTNVK